MSTQESNEKPILAVSIIGHVDSGKSTLTGRLATRFGCLNDRELGKLQKEADDNNKGSFAFAYFTDRTKEERERGVTINTTLVKMETEKFQLTLLDCPGHKDYIKNATSGCKQSDLSIVVVPARFEASVSAEGTLWTHLTLAAILGSKNFIVCVNKLDEVQITDDNSLKTAFDAARSAVLTFLIRLGVKEESVIFLPISALKGTGVFKGGETYPFFEGATLPGVEGKINSLEEAVNIQMPPSRNTDKSLRMPISNKANVPGQGVVICGRVDYGSFKPTDKVKILPQGVIAEVKSIEAHKQAVPIAYSGLNVGFILNLKDKKELDKIKAGSIVGSAVDSTFFTSNFYTISAMSMKKSGRSASEKGGIHVGYTPVISCGTANVACKFVKLLTSQARKQGVIENPTNIPHGAKFTAIICPTKPSVFERVDEYPGLAKFVCRDSGLLVVAGQVTDKINPQKEKELGLNLEEALTYKEGSKKAASAA